MQTCRACGKSTTDDAKFCPTCGTYFPGASAPAATGALPAPAPPAPASPAPAWGVPTGPGVRARPLGVTILSLLYFVLGVFAVLFGLAAVAFGPAVSRDPQVRSQLIAAGVPPDIAGSVFAVIGVLMLLVGIVGLVLGWGLWQGRGWSWTLIIVLQALGVIFGVLGMLANLASGSGDAAIGNLVGAAIGGFVLWYFLQPGVKRWFGKEAQAEPGLPSYVPPPPPAGPPGT